MNKELWWNRPNTTDCVLRNDTGEYWRVKVGTSEQVIHGDYMEVLREYFRDERDRELGRWRSPSDPIFVGYKTRPGKVKLVNEVSGDHEFYSRRQAGQFSQSEFDAIAEEYFDAHPEKKPAPWEDAPEGAVWKIVSGGRGKHALIWRSRMGDWDVLTPRGDSLKEVDDPLAALIEAGYPDFKEYKSAVEMKES